MLRRFDSIWSIGLGLVPVIAALIVFYPVTANYFREDDFVNLYFIENYGFARFLITIWAEHALVTRNAIWWALHAVAGVRPEPYFALALITHLAAVGVLFEAFRRLTKNAVAACLAVSIWGTLPLHEEAIGWFSVYGQLFATVLVGWLLVQIANVRDGAPFAWPRAACWVLLVLAVATSFGVGLGIALGLPVVAGVLVPAPGPLKRVVGVLAGAAALCFVVYECLIAIVWSLYGPFPHLPLSAALAVPGALLELLFLLSGNGLVSLLTGPFADRFGELGSGWWVVIVFWLGASSAVFVRAAPSERRVMVAGAALSFACYVALAGGRAPYFAQGIAFEREARYQYAATIGYSLITAVVLAHGLSRLRASDPARAFGAATFVTALLTLIWLYAPPINHHASERRETAAVLAAMRAQIHDAPPGADVYIANQRFSGVGFLIAAAGMDSFPGWAAVYAIFYPGDSVDGRRVHFVTEPAIVEAGRMGRRSSRLLVSPAPANAAAGVAP